MPVNPNPSPILNAHQPCKPRQSMTQAEKRPPVLRPGALDAAALPCIFMGHRVWPDGRKEPI